jgi:hypothetical protein
MELMRHESIETTLKYYVGRNAQSTADVLWAAHEAAGNIYGNSASKPSSAADHAVTHSADIRSDSNTRPRTGSAAQDSRNGEWSLTANTRYLAGSGLRLEGLAAQKKSRLDLATEAAWVTPCFP